MPSIITSKDHSMTQILYYFKSCEGSDRKTFQMLDGHQLITDRFFSAQITIASVGTLHE